MVTIYGTEIEPIGDVDNGLAYLERNWEDPFILEVFENAKTSQDRKGSFRINSNESGMYVLKYIAPHHFSLGWVD